MWACVHACVYVYAFVHVCVSAYVCVSVCVHRQMTMETREGVSSSGAGVTGDCKPLMSVLGTELGSSGRSGRPFHPASFCFVFCDKVH